MISAAANLELGVVWGMVEALASRGRVVPLGAGGICWAVRVDVFSFTVKRMLSSGEMKYITERVGM